MQMKTSIITSVFLLAVIFSAGQNTSIGAHMVLEPGTALHANTNLDVVAGELLLKANSTLIMGDGNTLSVNEGGAIKVLGNASEHAIVTSTGYFVFIVSDGGTIGANYATFEKMSGNGLNIQSGAVVDPNNPLSNCTFQQGSSGSTLLTINNNQYLNIEGAVFIFSPDMELYNVAKTLSQGIVNFTGYIGNFAGEDYEDDDYNRIFWGADAPFEELATGTIGSGTELCLDALDVIIVENLLVENGGIIDLIAGQKILMLPGVLVQNGGKLHAWISTDGIFCLPPSMLASSEPEPQLERSEIPHRVYEVGTQPLEQNETAIKFYPNPTTGDFTLKLQGFEESETVLIQIFTMQGNLVSAQEFPASSLYSMSLKDRQPGIYLVRVIQGNEVGGLKVIKK